MKPHWGVLTPNAELWCRRMDYAEVLPLWYKVQLSPRHKFEFTEGNNTLYQLWIEGAGYVLP